MINFIKGYRRLAIAGLGFGGGVGAVVSGIDNASEVIELLGLVVTSVLSIYSIVAPEKPATEK